MALFVFELGVWNAWLLSLLFICMPFLALALFGKAGRKRAIAKRMSDMTGFTVKEKAFTVLSSVSPYPFLLATVWTPFTAVLSLLCFGLLLYSAGMAMFAASLKAIIETPGDHPFSSGPYRISRNPVYVGATLVFAGICVATANLVLAGYLTVAVFPQHFMILAEERICRKKYGEVFEDYLKNVPRYLLIKGGER